MPGSVRIALIGWAFVLAADSAATLHTAASPPLQGPALSVSHQADQEAARRAKPISGQNIFRFDTFNDEQLWTNVLRMHEAIPSVNPVTALAVGLKVDVDALPPALIAALQAGQVDLTDPAVTIELLRLNAVVGIIGKVDDLGQLTSIGTTCALCHSTVDDSFTAGIRKRLDGWPNRDPQCRCDSRPVTRAGSRAQDRVQHVGTRQIRSTPPCVRRHEHYSADYSAG
jgi:hypothetical protein